MSLLLTDAAATEALGARLAPLLQARRGVVVALEGNLGAGKTTLVRGLLRALGVTGTIRSPTYTLMEPYKIGDWDILHLDLYRLQRPEEVLNLGLSDFPPDRALWLVEWPERGQGMIPSPDVTIRLAVAGTQRTAEVAGLAVSDIR